MKFHDLLNFQKTTTNDVILRKNKKCSKDEKITSGTVLESWDIIFFTKATLVNICWPLLTNSWNENSSKSWFFAKFTYPRCQIYDIRSQQLLTKIILMKSTNSQLSKSVSIISIVVLDQVFEKFQICNEFWRFLEFPKNKSKWRDFTKI